MKFGRILLTALVVMAGILPASVEAQTLGEVLRAVQKRNKLVQERQNVRIDLENSIRTSGGGPGVSGDPVPHKDIQLIQWSGLQPEPLDAQVDEMSVGNKISLLRQAWIETSKLQKYFIEPRQIAGGTGGLENIGYEEQCPNITSENYSWMLRLIASKLTNFKTLAWPVLWDRELYMSSPAGNLTAPPELPWNYFKDGSLVETSDSGKVVSDAGGLGLAVALWWGYYEHDAIINHTLQYSPAGGEVTYKINQLKSPPSYGGAIEMFSNFGYAVNQVAGLPESFSLANNQRWLEVSLAKDSSSEGNQGVSGVFGGDVSTLSLEGVWGSNTSSTGESTPYFQTRFEKQDSTELLASMFNPLINTGTQWNTVAGEFPTITSKQPDRYQNGYADENLLYYNSLASDGGGYSDSARASLGWLALYTASFNDDLKSSENIQPEKFPNLNIETDFRNARIKIRLANLPENDCELVWQFPERIQTDTQSIKDDFGALAARYVLRARGSGKWDAVFSGKPEDREPEFKWQGAYMVVNGRWPTFPSYVNEYWRPVLKQLVCATCGINIRQDQSVRARYWIDFYRKDQVGGKNSSGEYTFSGSPVETFTVENPGTSAAVATDAQAGKLKLATSNSGASYELSLAQDLNSDQKVTKSTWDFTGKANAKTFIYKYVVVTPQGDSESPCKEVDETTVNKGGPDEVKLPKVTTTYWREFLQSIASSGGDYRLERAPYLQYIDKVIEEGSGGMRTTTYSYAKDEGGNITHLNEITQTGGVNPYTAEYHNDAGLLTHYADTYGSVDVSYSGNKVTRTEKLHNQPVRTLETTYSGDMTQMTTVAK